MMTNEFDTTIKKILTNLNKHMITENILSNIELNKDTINENSAQSESSEMRIKFLNMITNFTLNNFDSLRENIKKETVHICNNLNTSKIMLINSLPNELLNTKMSYIIEYLSRSNSDLNSSDIKRNCISLSKEETETDKNIRMILFDLKQIKEKLIQTNHTKDNNNVNTDMLKIINPTNADNKLHDIKDKTPCFSKQMSKDIKVAGRKLVYKENEQTRTNMHEDNKNIIGNNCTNNETRNNTNNNLPKTKSTKLKDIKTFASRYRSPSPIITKKTKQVHTNHNFVKMKSDSNLFNIVVGPVPFTPVKNDNKSNINFSKPKSNNQKTPKVNNNNNHSPITSLHWLP